MKHGDLVFVRMQVNSGKKPVVMYWPGTVVNHAAGILTVEFNQPWRDGTTVVQVTKEDLA